MSHYFKMKYAKHFLWSLVFFVGPVRAYADDCSLVVEPGKYIGSAKQKKISFKKRFCFVVGETIFKSDTPLSQVQEKLFCSKDAKTKNKVTTISCAGIELTLMGNPGSYHITGLRITPLEPKSL